MPGKNIVKKGIYDSVKSKTINVNLTAAYVNPASAALYAERIMKEKEQEYYIGERGRRGNMLKRGFRNIVRISSETT